MNKIMIKSSSTDSVRFARVLRVAWVAVTLAGAGAAAYAEDNELGCGPRQLGEFGPFDYRTASPTMLYRVEHYHFKSDVEFLSKSLEARAIGADLDFTLRYFPNHHRAISTMIELAIRHKATHPDGMRYNLECWFLRAKTMAPDDPMIPVLHAIYFMRSGHPQDALPYLDEAKSLGGDEDVNVTYNLGLSYFELGRYTEAREYAKKAYALGHPLPGLRNKLIRAKQWQE